MILDRMGRHPMRPAHLHVAVTAPGYETLVTHLFVKGDPYIESDVVFGVKPSLIVDFAQNSSADAAKQAGLQAPFTEAKFDFVLKPAEGNKLQKMIAPSDAAA
jgi:catechol 1,2-dioxygenase